MGVLFSIISGGDNLYGLDVESFSNFKTERERLLFPYHQFQVDKIYTNRRTSDFPGRGEITLQCMSCFFPVPRTLASSDKTAKLLDVESGKCVKTFEGHKHWMNSAVFSSDSKEILT